MFLSKKKMFWTLNTTILPFSNSLLLQRFPVLWSDPSPCSVDDGEQPLQPSCTTWTFLHVGRTPKTRIILFRGPLIKLWMGQFVKSERKRQRHQHELQSSSINTEETRVVSKGALPALHPLLQSCTHGFSRNHHNHYFTCTICAKMHNFDYLTFLKAYEAFDTCRNRCTKSHHGTGDLAKDDTLSSLQVLKFNLAANSSILRLQMLGSGPQS